MAAPLANTIAMIGIIVSGSAVPTAASTDPTAPSARLEFPSEPLDAVREQLGTGKNEHERDRENKEIQDSGSDSAQEAGCAKENARQDDEKDEAGDQGHRSIADTSVTHR